MKSSESSKSQTWTSRIAVATAHRVAAARHLAWAKRILRYGLNGQKSK